MATKKTFEKAKVGGIEMKNRMVRSATFEGTAKEGKVSDRILDMHRDLAIGEVGLIITGYFCVSKSDNPAKGTVVITDDTSIPGMKKLAETVHEHGTKIVAQLNHAGPQLFAPARGPVYAPSDVADPISGIKPVPFTEDQIHDLVTEFGDAASRTQKAGFDGVQIHAAHGYLLSQFISTVCNKRTDAYGGNPLKNSRIILEILQEIKTRCGKDFPVWIKLNCSDFHPSGQGLNPDDFLVIATDLAKNGMDAIEVSGGTLSGKYLPSRSKKHAAYHLEYAKQLTEKTDASVILVGGLRSIDTIDQIFSETGISAISMSRPLIREPGLIKRWKEGDRKDAACIACNGCFNPKGTKCFFTLGEEEKAVQKEIMKFMSSLGGH
jgi:2,4-dienoyl-CoA reductase-like NADH-dependent reductase (Old Yellow Enzyme family)